MGALLELMVDVTMLHPRSLHWRNSLIRVKKLMIYQINFHLHIHQSHVHGTSQEKEKLKTSWLLVSSSKCTSTEVARGEDRSSPLTRDVRAPYQRTTWCNTDLCNFLHSVRAIESKMEKKMPLSLIQN